MADKRISHEGIVEEISGSKIRVKITSQAACTDCHARGACSISEVKEKLLDIPLNGSTYRAGEKVQVILAQSLGFRALFLGYVLPFLLVLLVLLVMTGLTENELLAGLLSLSILPPYYIGLKLSRGRIDRAFLFTLRKI